MKKASKFFGSTTLGKKGQVVILAETREKMGWKEGEKLLVFGLENRIVVLTKLDYVQEIANRLEKKINKINQIVNKTI